MSYECRYIERIASRITRKGRELSTETVKFINILDVSVYKLNYNLPYKLHDYIESDKAEFVLTWKSILVLVKCYKSA